MLISGDTLFPGGPGRSDNLADSAGDDRVDHVEAADAAGGDEGLPGHGDNATIGASKREYAVYASKEHAADLHGDVTWERS